MTSRPRLPAALLCALSLWLAPAPGRILPCELRVIRQGACTPVVFTFPGIDLGDYFEALPP